MEECMFLASYAPIAGRALTQPSDWDILFADDEREANPATFKFIQNALAWRMKDGGMDLSAALLAQDDEEEEEDDEKSSNEGDQRQPADSGDERSSNGMQED